MMETLLGVGVTHSLSEPRLISRFWTFGLHTEGECHKLENYWVQATMERQKPTY